MDLKCKRLDCVHNNEYGCTAKEILVQPNLSCATFEKRAVLPQVQQQDVSRDMLKEIPQIHPYRHSRSIYIGCKAKCLFNKEGHCVANGITIDHEKAHGMCYTHIEK